MDSPDLALFHPPPSRAASTEIFTSRVSHVVRVATSDFGGDAEECFTQATGMIFIYLVIWQVGVYCTVFHVSLAQLTGILI